MSDGFWLFDGLEDDPYGLLPLNNLSGKVSATATKYVDRIGSYQWYLQDDEPTILIPGMPKESFFFPGGRLPQDRGVVVYDVNHFKVPQGPLDPIILAARHLSQKRKKPINFDEFDFITDSINLQKLFAFAQEAGDGLFRIDCERVGKTVLLTRVEASDLMEVGHLTYDQALKHKMTKPRSKHAGGPFFQLVAYQFGQFRILVRYEVDAGDYAAAKVGEFDKEVEQLPERKKFAENQGINFVDFGDISKAVPLQQITTYPAGGGFPFFTWAQMFFTAAEQEVVGFFKDNGDVGKPSFYALTDISRLMKPLPYAVLSKVHDALAKIRLFLVKNDPEFRCGLIWKGKPHLEIFAKKPEAQSAVSPGIKEYLATVCKDPVPDEPAA
uniref:RNA_ligase domain-containing protein n=1 Tax=Panagrellus redivivus TaxID=6233 RepID=A0A7E4UQ42_PANRE